ncbi:glycoside hydrolase superfamily [Armillaria novae-zelandiae]|uniref:Glycoside hydrolase superfamily n=1 Tax=Armillaria novae-zelandiae TaxID=153914 RepID=A0AA39NKX1_9AGAR|nr:glycoside hydrolase superfamily [Armillaria novae-zelandiae]
MWGWITVVLWSTRMAIMDLVMYSDLATFQHDVVSSKDSLFFFGQIGSTTMNFGLPLEQFEQETTDGQGTNGLGMSEFGILVWKDFQFTCGVYPAYKVFVASVCKEATDNVKQLRHHPSIALFHGNNKDYQMILQWGDVKLFPAIKIYEDMLPSIVKALCDPPIPYHHGSLYGGQGWDTADLTVRDVYQWNIWGGGKELPYQEYDLMAQEWHAQRSFERCFAIVMNENFRVTEDLETYAFRMQMRPKPVYYTIKQHLDTFVIGLLRTFYDFGTSGAVSAKLDIWASNLMLKQCLTTLKLQFVDLKSNCVATKEHKVVLLPNQSSELISVACPGAHATVVIGARLLDDRSGKVLAHHIDWPQLYKYQALPDPRLKVTVTENRVELQVEKPAKCMLLTTKSNVTWSDNTIDLMPGEKRIVEAKRLIDKSELQVAFLGCEKAFSIP